MPQLDGAPPRRAQANAQKASRRAGSGASFIVQELLTEHVEEPGAALRTARSVIVVSQGTVDNRDPEKLFVPSLTAFAGGPHVVVAATGGRHTAALRKRFPQDNVIVEDWLDFDRLLEHAHLFICNGGYGSIMQALVNGVPILSAGKLEGKNDINARLDWRGLGVDLRTERPTARQIARGAARIMADARIRDNLVRLQVELASYQPFQLIEAKLAEDGVLPSEAFAELSA